MNSNLINIQVLPFLCLYISNLSRKQTMFKSLYETIVNKISEYNPIRNFIKYALDKTLNQFLSRELTLDDFKNGPLNLSNLQLNVTKINSTSLVSSPYILHSGVIGRLKIALPPMSQISTKSIEICVSNFEINLKPNKQFYQKFKTSMEELSQLNMFNVQEEEFKGQISENSPVDFFKQLLKSIIINIKIKVQGIIVKLYMNTPSSSINTINNNKNPQYYIMLRIPSIKIERDQTVNSKKAQQEMFKFKIQTPQISVHLLREDTQYPQYCNLKVTPQSFPFEYPPITHPSTLLLIGGEKTNQQNYKRNTNLTFLIITDYEKKTRDFTMKLDVSNFEVMLNPLQIKIVSRFLVQMKEFKTIFNNVLDELDLRTSINNVDQLNLRKTLSKSGNIDLFSSMVTSVNQFFPSSGLKKKKDGMVQNFINQNKKDVDQLYNKFKQQLAHSTQSEEARKGVNSQFRVTDFKTLFSFKVQIGFINIYILKYSTQNQYFRRWLSGFQTPKKINDTIGCSHFMIFFNKSQLLIDDGGKNIQFCLRKAKIYDVRLISKPKSENDQFYDIGSSSQYYRQKDYNEINKIQLIDFQIDQGDHFCCEELVRISQKKADTFKSQNIKIYSFLPPNHHKQNSLFQYGFDFKFDKKNNQIKINILEAHLSANLGVVKDFLMIAYPVFTYKRLSEVIELKLQSLGQYGQTKKKKKTLFESQYDNQRQSIQQSEDFGNKNSAAIAITINQVKFSYRKCMDDSQFEQLVKNYKQKVIDFEKGSDECFCNVNGSAIYGECTLIQFQKKQALRLICKNILTGIISIKNSQITNQTAIINLESDNEDTIKIFKTQGQQSALSIYLPKLSVRLNEEIVKLITELVFSELTSALNVVDFHRYLTNQMGKIQMKVGTLEKKQKKLQKLPLQIELYINTINIGIYSTISIIKDLFFTNQNQQIMLKLSTIILALKRNKNIKIPEFKGKEVLMSEYLQKQDHNKILQSDIILQVGQEYNTDKKLQVKNKARFFLSESQSKKIIHLRIGRIQQKQRQSSKKRNLRTDLNFSAKFNFKNKAVESIIEQERYSKAIQLDIHSTIFISGTNALQLLKIKEQIEQMVNKMKRQSSSINLIDSKSIMMERKDSSDIDSQQIDLNIKIDKINIDIRPYYLNQAKQLVYANTRSILSISNIQFQLNMIKEIFCKKIRCELPDIKYYFLYHEDRDTLLNPFIVNQRDYSNLGFKPILEINGVYFKAIMQDKRIIIKDSTIQSIAVNMSVHCITLIIVHLDYLINHNLKNNYDWMTEQSQEVYQQLRSQDMKQSNSEEEYQIEDLSEALGIYKKKIQQKKLDDSQFRVRPFNKRDTANALIDLSELSLENIIIRIYNGSDFKFKELQSLNRAAEKKRERSENVDPLKYLQLNFKKLMISVAITEEEQKNKSIYSFISFAQCEIMVSSNKSSEGFIKRLIGGKQYEEQVLYSLFRNESEMRIIFNITKTKVQFKLSRAKISAGFTSNLIKIMDEFKKYENYNNMKGIKKKYKKQIDNKKLSDNMRKLLFHLPELKVILSIQYNGLDFINGQSIKTNQFMINQQFSNKAKISSDITKWVKQLIFNNVGGIISGSMIKLLGNVFDQIIQVIRLIFEKIFTG